MLHMNKPDEYKCTQAESREGEEILNASLLSGLKYIDSWIWWPRWIEFFLSLLLKCKVLLPHHRVKGLISNRSAKWLHAEKYHFTLIIYTNGIHNVVYMSVVEETPSRGWNNLIFPFSFFSFFYGSPRRLHVTKMGNDGSLGVFSFLRGSIIYAKKKQKAEMGKYQKDGIWIPKF